MWSVRDNQSDMYNAQFEIYDKLIHLNHGDSLRGKAVNHFPKFVTDRQIDYLVTGHVHHDSLHQFNGECMHKVVGSPMGSNDYSKENNFGMSDPCQSMTVFNQYGPDVHIPVFLGLDSIEKRTKVEGEIKWS